MKKIIYVLFLSCMVEGIKADELNSYERQSAKQACRHVFEQYKSETDKVWKKILKQTVRYYMGKELCTFSKEESFDKSDEKLYLEVGDWEATEIHIECLNSSHSVAPNHKDNTQYNFLTKSNDRQKMSIISLNSTLNDTGLFWGGNQKVGQPYFATPYRQGVLEKSSDGQKLFIINSNSSSNDTVFFGGVRGGNQENEEPLIYRIYCNENVKHQVLFD